MKKTLIFGILMILLASSGFSATYEHYVASFNDSNTKYINEGNANLIDGNTVDSTDPTNDVHDLDMWNATVVSSLGTINTVWLSVVRAITGGGGSDTWTYSYSISTDVGSCSGQTYTDIVAASSSDVALTFANVTDGTIDWADLDNICFRADYDRTGPDADIETQIDAFWVKIDYTFVADTTPPNIRTLAVNVSNRSFYNETQGYAWNATVTDTSGINDVWFEANFSGTAVNYTATVLTGDIYQYRNETVAGGFYYYRWWANDTNESGSPGNINSTTNQLYQINRSSPRLNITIDGFLTDQTDDDSTTHIIYAYANGSNDGDRLTQQGRIELFYNDTASSRLLLNISAMNVTNGSTFIEGGYLFNATYNQTENYTFESFTLLLTINAPVSDIMSFSILTTGASTVNISHPTFPGNITLDLWFNATGRSSKFVQPCISGGTNCQDKINSVPIMIFKNTGTMSFNFTITLNNTPDPGVVLWGNWSNGTSIENCAAHSLAPDSTRIVVGTVVNFSRAICPNNETDIYLFANFTDVAVGIWNSTLNYTSNDT